MKTALILVDLQNDYFPAGKMELVGSVEASQRAARLLAFFREALLPLVHIQYVSTRPTAAFFVPDTVGVQTHANVQPLKGETVYQKHFPNSFRETPLLAHLQREQIERVVIAGMMTHMCVDATVRAAFDFGYQCLVAEDACATRALMHAGQTVRAEDVQRAFLAALNGTYGKVLSVDDIIAELKT
jgi:nicotinamidase-related amidase